MAKKKPPVVETVAPENSMELVIEPNYENGAIIIPNASATKAHRTIAEQDANAVKCCNAYPALMQSLKDKADNAYCDYIAQLKRDACLGWEEKVRTGKFTQDNLDAFMRAAESLGRHKAYSEMQRRKDEACIRAAGTAAGAKGA